MGARPAHGAALCACAEAALSPAARPGAQGRGVFFRRVMRPCVDHAARGAPSGWRIWRRGVQYLSVRGPTRHFTGEDTL